MAATADVQECNGADTGTWTTVTNARFCTKDVYNPGTTFPVPIPSDGPNYSYWKSHCLSFGGSFTQITNIKIYTDGTDFGTGITTNVGNETIAEGAYVQATGTEGETGTEMVTGHSGITGKTGFFTFDVDSKKDVDAGPIEAPGRCKHIVLQLDVASSATQGVLSPETITWVYDEI